MKIKWVLRILGVVALLVAALSVTAANNAKKAPKQLVVDFAGTVLVPSGSGLMDVGELGYFAGEVYEEGQFGVAAALIGEFKRSFVATEGVGTAGSIGQAVFRFGEGDIYVSDVFDIPEPGVFRFQGVITGTNGEFRLASGEFSAISIAPGPPVVIRATFTFNRGQN